MKLLPQRSTLIEQAYGAILDAICDGSLEPEKRITQEEIAARLGVSRQPITHALALLKAQGFVVDHGRRGLAVVPVSSDLIGSIYEYRSVIDPLAVKLAIPRLNRTSITALKGIMARGRALNPSSSRSEAIELDMEFHLFLYRLSGNSILATSMELHWQHLRRMMAAIHVSPKATNRVWNEHAAIAEAILTGESDMAAEFMASHLKNAYERLNANSKPSPVASVRGRKRQSPAGRRIDRANWGSRNLR